jgi:hypothetical protein|tara:strand:+ start:66 stop:254 length:189 start_codon:yes stop_codon:yes gene_type:complete
MAKRDSMLFNFFEKWKEKRLNKFAKQALKDNPDLETALRNIDKMHQKAIEKLKKQPKRTFDI